MKYHFIAVLLLSFIFFGCSNKPLEVAVYKKVDKKLSFKNDIKPILDKRCISCHSCYNSPCQLNLASYDGLLRGASKDEVYANRLTATKPTRLFVDANNISQWRELGFFSVSDKIYDNTSIMEQFLFQKELNKQIVGEYSPETDKLSCVKNQDELEKYFEKNPHKAMPYGFPAITKDEYNTLMSWLNQENFEDDLIDDEILDSEKKQIEKLENFLNNSSIKHQVTARYIYEHLFLAHIYFDENSGNFFELIRSKTNTGEKPQIIPTRFPYDLIEDKFYYRVQKVKSTIVHKTHMTYKIDDKKLKFFNDNFIKPAWE